eukprot:scaffold2310_cov53-Phaeocystis_antarctica.AAC.1
MPRRSSERWIHQRHPRLQNPVRTIPSGAIPSPIVRPKRPNCAARGEGRDLWQGSGHPGCPAAEAAGGGGRAGRRCDCCEWWSTTGQRGRPAPKEGPLAPASKGGGHFCNFQRKILLG